MAGLTFDPSKAASMWDAEATGKAAGDAASGAVSLGAEGLSRLGNLVPHFADRGHELILRHLLLSQRFSPPQLWGELQPHGMNLIRQCLQSTDKSVKFKFIHFSLASYA